ncbi:MAG: HDIG domain-containing metalloprotein [Leptospirales bacterium]
MNVMKTPMWDSVSLQKNHRKHWILENPKQLKQFALLSGAIMLASLLLVHLPLPGKFFTPKNEIVTVAPKTGPQSKNNENIPFLQKTSGYASFTGNAALIFSAVFLTGVLLFVLYSIYDAIHGSPHEFETINKNQRIPILGILLLVPVVLDLGFWPLIAPSLPETLHSSGIKASILVLPAVTASVLGTLLIGQRLAAGLAIGMGIVIAFLSPTPIWLGLFVLISALFASQTSFFFRGRLGLIQAGITTGLFLFLLNGVIHIWEEPMDPYPALWLFLISVGGCIFSVLAAIFLLPLLEKGFGILSDMSLTELLDVNHPLLRDFYWKAPGSYQHSMALSYLSEAAALSIGENTKLARVSAYFHDVGKMDRPQYFIENQATYNRHELLTPRMSAMILIDHVRRGMELARKFHLPEVVVQAIPEHHGTRLMQFFYRKAFDQSPESSQPTQDSDFRYPGPKPHSKITAIIMLADAVEASGRVLQRHHPTPARIKGMVEEVFSDILKDGQLDEAPLSLADLAMIRNTFTHILVSIYHHRVPYPKAFPAPPVPKGQQEPKKSFNAN